MVEVAMRQHLARLREMRGGDYDWPPVELPRELLCGVIPDGGWARVETILCVSRCRWRQVDRDARADGATEPDTQF